MHGSVSLGNNSNRGDEGRSKRNIRREEPLHQCFRIRLAATVSSHSPAIQRLALTLAVLLLVGPVGTSLARCLSAESGGHDQRPAPTEQAVSAAHMHDCSGELGTVDLDPALQPDRPRSLRLTETGGPELEPAVSVAPSLRGEETTRKRAPPSRSSLPFSLRSVRTVVLLV